MKIFYDRKSADYEFLVKIAEAALGGGKSSDSTVNKDTGEGIEEMTQEQEDIMRSVLGKDFDTLYEK